MPYQDHHRLGLNPAIWSSDTELRGRLRQGVEEVLRLRFPYAQQAFLVGDLVGHYYTEESSLDLLVVLPPEHLAEAHAEALTLRDRFASGTEHPLCVVPISTGVAPAVLQQKFGPLFDLRSWIWLGTRATTRAELAETKALLRRINWRIFKDRKLLENPQKKFWSLEEDIFTDLPLREQLEVLEELGYRLRRMSNYLDRALVHEPKEIWQAVNQLEQELTTAFATGESLVPVLSGTNAPTRVKELLLQRLRLEDLRETLQDVAARSKEQQDLEVQMKSLPIAAGVKEHKAMTSTKLVTVSYYPAVVVRGGAVSLDTLEEKLAARNGRKVSRSSRNALLLTEVSPKSVQALSAAALRLGLTVEPGNVVQIKVQEEVVEKVAAGPALSPGVWYWAEAKEDTYPFVMARRATPDGWEVELLTASNAVSTRKTLSAEELAGFGLRPATEKDFEALDLPVPQSQHLVQAALPPVDLDDTMSEAISLSSPSGRMSKRERTIAVEKLRVKLFGPNGLAYPTAVQPSEIEYLRNKAQELRELAARGMKTRAYNKKADELEAQANDLEVSAQQMVQTSAKFIKKPVGYKPTPKRPGTKRLATAPNLASLRAWNLDVPARSRHAALGEGSAVWAYWNQKRTAAGAARKTWRRRNAALSGYYVSVTYNTYSVEDAEAGEISKGGFLVEPTHVAEMADVPQEIPHRFAPYMWNSSYRRSTDSLLGGSSAENDRDFYEKGLTTEVEIFVERRDGKPLGQHELVLLDEALASENLVSGRMPAYTSVRGARFIRSAATVEEIETLIDEAVDKRDAAEEKLFALRRPYTKAQWAKLRSEVDKEQNAIRALMDLLEHVQREARTHAAAGSTRRAATVEEITNLLDDIVFEIAQVAHDYVKDHPYEAPYNPHTPELRKLEATLLYEVSSGYLSELSTVEIDQLRSELKAAGIVIQRSLAFTLAKQALAQYQHDLESSYSEPGLDVDGEGRVG